MSELTIKFKIEIPETTGRSKETARINRKKRKTTRRRPACCKNKCSPRLQTVLKAVR